MKRWIAGAGAVAALALVLPASALAGSLTLHPAGFGAHSYSAWKAQQGLPDSSGTANQALYFQKMVPTPTFAAGVAVIRGVEGLKLSDLTGLSWFHREDGHCGAGAPRWNITVQNSSGMSSTIFLGCNAANHSEDGMGSGHGWCKDTQPSPASMPGASSLTITGLAIVFDEGNDTPNPQPAGCNQEQLNGGFVFLDNIDVQIDGMDHCWTSASDNSNQPSACPDPPSGNAGVTGTNTGQPAGVPLDSSDTSLLGALDLAIPGVSPSSWLLYPGVY